MKVTAAKDVVIGHRLVLAGETVEVDARLVALLPAGVVTEVTGSEMDEVLPFTVGFDAEPVEAAAVPVAVKKQRKGGK